MTLPFSRDAFLDVFGTYNRTLWPFAVVLWLATAWAALVWWRRRRLDARLLFTLLAVHWAWSGVVYHWMYFRPINPAAGMFAALFVAQAAISAFVALRTRGDVLLSAGMRGTFALALVVYGLAYPAVGLAGGLTYPRLPLFAVPCPTTLITAGWLLAPGPAPRAATAIPLSWALVGTTAAFNLGIRGDIALVAAAVALAFTIAKPAV